MAAARLWRRPRIGPGQGLAFDPDLDAIEALAAERESLWRRVAAADFLTADEKREAVGYGRSPLPGGERRDAIPSPLRGGVGGGGRWAGALTEPRNLRHR